MSKYILIIIQNVGKTTLGRRVAEILQLHFFNTDSDEEIVLETLQKSGKRGPVLVEKKLSCVRKPFSLTRRNFQNMKS